MHKLIFRAQQRSHVHEVTRFRLSIVSCCCWFRMTIRCSLRFSTWWNLSSCVQRYQVEISFADSIDYAFVCVLFRRLRKEIPSKELRRIARAPWKKLQTNFVSYVDDDIVILDCLLLLSKISLLLLLLFENKNFHWTFFLPFSLSFAETLEWVESRTYLSFISSFSLMRNNETNEWNERTKMGEKFKTIFKRFIISSEPFSINSRWDLLFFQLTIYY